MQLELEITSEPIGRNGTAKITAQLGGRVLAVDKVEIASATERERFTKSLCDTAPNIDADIVRERLTELAAQHRRATKKAKPHPVNEKFYLTEQANAQRFTEKIRNVARFNVTSERWMIHENGRLTVDDTGEIVRLAKADARALWTLVANPPEGIEPKAIAKHATESEKARGIAAMLKLAQSEPGIPVRAAELDANPWLFNCRNGTLDLKPMRLRPHSPDDLLSHMAPVDYDPNAPCPRWQQFIDEITDGNDNLAGYLQRIAGMALTADVSEQELYIFHGPGGNGKNVFLDTLSGLMGDYAAEAPPNLLTARMQDEHPTEIADLAGKRLVIASETEEGAKLRVQLVKRLTGNATIKARFMRQDYFQFPRTHKLILVTNNQPAIRETTNAIWRRVRLVPFHVVIPPEQQDPRLLDKLQVEWSGILHWCLLGCRDWVNNGMQTPGEVMIATENYRSEQDPLADFIGECCIVGDANTFRATRTDLYHTYQAWCQRTGERHGLDRSGLFERIRKLPGVEESQWRQGDARHRGFRGIGVMCHNASETAFSS